MEDDYVINRAIMFLYGLGIILLVAGIYISKVMDLWMVGIGIVMAGLLMFVLPMTRKRYV